MTDLDPDSRSLIDLARGGDGPTPDDRRRVMRGVATAIAAGAAATAITATTSAAARVAGVSGAAGTGGFVGIGGKALAWLGAGALFGAAVTGTVVATRGEPAPTPRAAVTQPAPPRAALPAPATERAAVESPAPEAPEVAPPPVEPLRRPQAAQPVRGSLSAETTLLDEARLALGRGDARAALALLDRHRREFPSGALVEERLGSEVFALCGVGRRAEAAARARELLRLAPASPLRARVMDSCAFEPEPTP